MLYEPLTDDQLLAFLSHPAINISYFARKVYDLYNVPDSVKKSDTTKFHMKLENINGMKFTKEEMKKIREAITEFSNTEL